MNHSVRARINRRNLFLQLIALEGNVYVLECCEFFSELSLYPKPSLKIGSVNKAFLFWFWQRLKKYFFRNKTFLFFKIESWNFKHLFEKGFRETAQSFNSFSLFRQLLFSFFLWVVWLHWNFLRFHEILFQTDSESFSFLIWKTKKFYS